MFFQAETDEMYAKINELQENTREANADSDAEVRRLNERLREARFVIVGRTVTS